MCAHVFASVFMIVGALHAAELEVKKKFEGEQECAVHSPYGLTSPLVRVRCAEEAFAKACLMSVGLVSDTDWAIIGTRTIGLLALHAPTLRLHRIPHDRLRLSGQGITSIACATRTNKFAVASLKEVALGTLVSLEDYHYQDTVSRATIEQQMNVLAFDPTESHVAAGCNDGSLCVWDFERTERYGEYTWSDAASLERSIPIRTLTYLDNKVVCCNAAAGLALCDLRVGKMVLRVVQNDARVTALSASTATQVIGSGDEEGVVRIFDIRKLQKPRGILRHQSGSPVTSVAAHPVYHELWAGFADGACWLVRTRLSQKYLSGSATAHQAMVSAIAVSGEGYGYRAVSVGRDGVVNLWGPEPQLDEPAFKVTRGFASLKVTARVGTKD